ncbi:hypothetical protein [[Mycoplasma] imitans]|uniref:hypothetical protein n=1 Tax=[Mycoplasma] imitans TaxID=29560 RepID=UPI000687DC43|nr:hypothetical protein [[Mycoplasma] imitans]
MPYLKLGAFKARLRFLSVIPFSALFINRLNSNQFSDNQLTNDSNTNSKWYLNPLQSNRVVFRIKLRLTIIYLTLIYIGFMIGYIAYASYISLNYAFGYYLTPSKDVANAYSIDFLNFTVYSNK